jgi:hypothetical protein
VKEGSASEQATGFSTQIVAFKKRAFGKKRVIDAGSAGLPARRGSVGKSAAPAALLAGG